MERALSDRGISPAITWRPASGWTAWATALDRTSHLGESVNGAPATTAIVARAPSADAVSITRQAPRDVGGSLAARHPRRQAGRVHPLWLVVGALLLFVACGGLGSPGGRTAGHSVGVHRGTHHRHHGRGRRVGAARGARDGGLLATFPWTGCGDVSVVAAPLPEGRQG